MWSPPFRVFAALVLGIACCATVWAQPATVVDTDWVKSDPRRDFAVLDTPPPGDPSWSYTANVWDGGPIGNGGCPIPDWQPGFWAEFDHLGSCFDPATHQWFRTSLDLTAFDRIQKIELIAFFRQDGNIGINDNLYVWINPVAHSIDEIAAYGGTSEFLVDQVPFPQALLNRLPPSPVHGVGAPCGGPDGVPETEHSIEPMTLPLGLFQPGNNTIDVLLEDFCIFGGMSHLAFRIWTCACDIAPAIRGTSGSDVLVGTPGDDVICGFGGADIVDGGRGNDCIVGGAGHDILLGGAGNDLVLGGSGADLLLGESGEDELRGGAGEDLLLGGLDGDWLLGGGHHDLLVGGEGDDELLGGGQADELLGNAGDDRIRGQGGNDTLRGGLGEDLLAGGAGADDLHGGMGNDGLHGGAGPDQVSGGSGVDELRGGRGDDLLRGGHGADTLAGGDGADHLNGGGDVDTCHGGAGEDTSSRCEVEDEIP